VSIEEELKGRFRNEYHKGLINLSYTVKQLSYNFLQSLKKHKLAESQYNILRVLRGFRSEGAVSIGFLKERMLDKHSDVSRLVDKLHERGLIDRTENKVDRRQKAIVITPKGLELLSAMDECEEKVDTLLGRLDAEEILLLNKLLDKIRG
jgi:MarR family transcriptional regulator, multiple gene regulator MgrA